MIHRYKNSFRKTRLETALTGMLIVEIIHVHELTPRVKAGKILYMDLLKLSTTIIWADLSFGQPKSLPEAKERILTVSMTIIWDEL